MLIKKPRGWEIAESAATPEHVFMNRRAFMIGTGSIAAAGSLPAAAFAAKKDEIPTADLYPAKRNEKYKITRTLTPEVVSSRYNNFYEFGSGKQIWREAQKLPIRPWEIKIAGHVEQPFSIGIDDLVRKVGIEERLYRHRCVEAWAMTVPWTGFPLSKLVELAKPLSSAKYVRFETFKNPKVAKEQRSTWYPWPYTEAVTIEEAMNDLAFMVTGAYGKPLAKQFGAPVRLALPWKYGFKSIKSIVRISFESKRPTSFWEEVQAREYGFWANVHPAYPHPRWSQATEQLLGSGTRVKTQVFNGYGEFVADLYKGLEHESLYR